MLVFVQRLRHSGVLLVRLDGLDPEDSAERVAETIEQNEFALASGLGVLSEQSLRIRKTLQ